MDKSQISSKSITDFCVFIGAKLSELQNRPTQSEAEVKFIFDTADYSLQILAAIVAETEKVGNAKEFMEALNQIKEKLASLEKKARKSKSKQTAVLAKTYNLKKLEGLIQALSDFQTIVAELDIARHQPSLLDIGTNALRALQSFATEFSEIQVGPYLKAKFKALEDSFDAAFSVAKEKQNLSF